MFGGYKLMFREWIFQYNLQKYSMPFSCYRFNNAYNGVRPGRIDDEIVTEIISISS